MKSRSYLLPLLGILFCAMFNTHSTMAQIGPVVSVSENQQSLPDAVLSFLGTHFPTATIAKAEFEIQDNCYEINLSNGYEVEVRPDGQWLKVDAPNSAVIPESILRKLLSSKIIDHLKKKNVLGNVEEISYYPINGYYEVDIYNGKDLWFDANGHPTREPRDNKAR